MNKHLVLVGMMGSGKSTVGRWLHDKTGLPLIDTDTIIVEAEKRTISDIFRDEGEEYFRRLERFFLKGLLEGAEKPMIISTGGGLFVDPENRKALLKEGVVFYLRASAEELADRTGKGTHRPLLDGKDHLAELREKLAVREASYALAHHTIDGERPIREIEEEILALWKKES